MTEQYSCKICGTYEIRTDGWAGSGSTSEDCKACDNYLMDMERNLLHALNSAPMFWLPVNNERNRISAVFLYRNRALEALNFCISSLDRASAACSSHQNYNPLVALRELTRYKKSDFDPNRPPPFDIQFHAHANLLYNLSLAAFAIYGPSVFARECLRRAYHCNSLLLYFTARELFPIQPEFLGQKAQDAAMYGIFGDIWKIPGALEWLRDSEPEVKLRPCDAVRCSEVEKKVGEMKMCNGCKQAWYCGPACQTRDWKAGMHRTVCKQAQAELARYRSIMGE